MSSDIRKASEDYFDTTQAVADVGQSRFLQVSFLLNWMQLLQMNHTFGEHVVHADLYHVDVTRKQLTKNIDALFPEVFDELKYAFSDHIPQTEGLLHT